MLGTGKRCLQHEHVLVAVGLRETLGVVVEQSWVLAKHDRLSRKELVMHVRQDMAQENYVQ
jgi:hypothetical protein